MIFSSKPPFKTLRTSEQEVEKFNNYHKVAKKKSVARKMTKTDAANRASIKAYDKAHPVGGKGKWSGHPERLSPSVRKWVESRGGSMEVIDGFDDVSGKK